MTAERQSRIIHSVIFTLKHPRESAEAERFLADGKRILSGIPVVEQFVVNLQVSPKNDYDYGFSMAFADQAAYEAYNAHPLHEAFVQERWETEVERFLEIDYVQWG